MVAVAVAVAAVAVAVVVVVAVVETDADDDEDDADAELLRLMLLMMLTLLLLMLLVPFCTFWPAGPLLGVSPLNPARGPLAVSLPYGSSLLSVGERGRPLPPTTACRQKLPRFTVFCARRIFSHFSDLVAQDGSTWANIGRKRGQHSLKMGQQTPQDGPT